MAINITGPWISNSTVNDLDRIHCAPSVSSTVVRREGVRPLLLSLRRPLGLPGALRLLWL
jgi:hypothetical protein